jgi:hypothetical protein
MIEYSPPTLFDMKDVTLTTNRSNDRWSLRATHRPSGECVIISGNGKYEHAINERRVALEELEDRVNKYYKDYYDSTNS